MDDLISRQAVISELQREAGCGDRDYEKGLNIAISILELFPSAERPESEEVQLLTAELVKMEERRNYWEEMALSYERTIAKLQKAIEEMTNETN